MKHAWMLAAAWAVLFALPNFYWAAGGNAGTETIAADTEALGVAAEPAVLALTGVMKLLLAAFALRLGGYFSWSRISPTLVLWIGVALSAGSILYGAANLVDHASMVTGLRDTPPRLGDYAARWHLLFWDPVWLTGGVLFALATLRFRETEVRRGA